MRRLYPSGLPVTFSLVYPALARSAKQQLAFLSSFYRLSLWRLRYFVFNSVFVALALALERTTNAFTIWKNNFLWLSVNYFGGASVAALLVSYTQTVDVTVLGDHQTRC